MLCLPIPVWAYRVAMWAVRDMSSAHPGIIQSVFILGYEVKNFRLKDVIRHNRMMITEARDLCYSRCEDDYTCPKCSRQQATFTICNQKCSDNYLKGMETYVWYLEDLH